MGLEATYKLASRFLEYGLVPFSKKEAKMLSAFAHGSAVSGHPYRDILDLSVKKLRETKRLTWGQAIATRFDVVSAGWFSKMALWFHTRDLTRVLAGNTEFLQAWIVKTQENSKNAMRAIQRLSPESLLELYQTGGLDRWKSVLTNP